MSAYSGNITANGTTSRTDLTPGQMYLISVENAFDGATVVVQTPGGVKYLPFDGSASITEANAAEFRAINNKLDIVVAGGGASIDLDVSLTPINPQR